MLGSDAEKHARHDKRIVGYRDIKQIFPDHVLLDIVSVHANNIEQ